VIYGAIYQDYPPYWLLFKRNVAKKRHKNYMATFVKEKALPLVDYSPNGKAKSA
jgi:hypothetical protein